MPCAEVEMTSIRQSYGLAVLASCTIAIGSGKLMKLYPRLTALGPFVPYVAVVAAGSCNVAFTRMDEMTNGVTVTSDTS